MSELRPRAALITLAALALLANGLILLDPPLLVKTTAVVTLTVLLPGWVVARLWIGGARQMDGAEMAVYALSAGFGVQTVTALLLSYWPGPLGFWQTLLVFNLLCAGLAIALWVAGPQQPSGAMDLSGPTLCEGWRPVWAVAAPVIVIGVAGFLRFANLDYAEFQGDEGRALLRATAVLQGYDNVLFLHRKGPQEILTPAVTYALTGRLTEAAARLPFAVAGVAGVWAIYCLGRRLFGPLAGSAAALLLAVDGYLIGFARIVQYQSIVLLMTATALLSLVQMSESPRRQTMFAVRRLTFAAFLIGAGVLAHYEAIAAAIPALYLVWQARRQVALATMGVATIVGALPIALFYIPYVASPIFADTLLYLADERIGGQPPYNHLADFFIRTTLYSTSYAVLLQIGLVLAAILTLYRRAWPAPWSWVAMLGLVAGVLFAFVNPSWLTIGGQDYTVLFFAALFFGTWALPGVDKPERMLWLWFGLLVLVALFLIAKPRTHVYVFMIPWALLSGMMIVRICVRLAAAIGSGLAHALTATALTGCLLLFGAYAYWYFVYNDVEILGTWDENRPAGYWAPYSQPDDQSIFGFPNRSGWKAVGVLYDQGVLQGPYASRNTDAWVTDWYTRGAERCLRNHRYFMVSDRLGHRETERRAAILGELASSHHPIATILVQDRPRLQIWQPGAETEPDRMLPIEQFISEFDTRLSGPKFPLYAPAVEPVIQHPLTIAFGDQIMLKGYALDRAAASPGDTVRLTLFWRANQPLETRYVVVNLLRRDTDGAVAAQAQGEPGCDAQRTTDWGVGELIQDVYYLTLAGDAAPGRYSIIMRMETRDTGDVLRSAQGESTTIGALEIEN